MLHKAEKDSKSYLLNVILHRVVPAEAARKGGREGGDRERRERPLQPRSRLLLLPTSEKRRRRLRRRAPPLPPLPSVLTRLCLGRLKRGKGRGKANKGFAFAFASEIWVMGPFALFLPRRKKEEDAEWGLERKFPPFFEGPSLPKKHLSIFCAYDSGSFLLLRGEEQDHFCVWGKKDPLVLPPTKKEREERVDCFQKVFVFRPCFFLPEMIFLFAFSFPCPSFSFLLLLQCFCFQKYPPPVYSQTASAKKKTQRGNSRLRRRESDFFLPSTKRFTFLKADDTQYDLS